MTDYSKNALKLTCILWIITIGDHNTSADIFTSLIQMKKLPVLEAQMLSHLREYIDILQYDVFGEIANVTEDELDELVNFYNHTTRENKAMQENIRCLENPIDSFRLLRRMVRQWNGVIRYIRCHNCTDYHASRDFTEIASKIQKKISWPKEEDFVGAAVALTRLIMTYKLNIDDLANGRIYDVQSSPLSAEDFSLIGDVAMEKEMFHEAAIMYNMSNAIIKRTENYVPTDILYNLTSDEVNGLSKRGSYLKLLTALLQAEAMKQYEKVITEAGTFYPDIFYSDFIMRRFTKASRPTAKNDLDKRSFMRDNTINVNYVRLCNSDIKTADEQSALYCTYWSSSSVLMKAKAEYMNLNPPVVVFHDILADFEIKWLKTVTKNWFERSEVFVPKGVYSDIRISQTAWLEDVDDVVIKLSKRIESLTGLNVLDQATQTNSEAYQLVNYGLGGMYEPHIDAVNKGTNDPVGKRIATWIYYLNDVTYGGATVFPLLRTRIPAKKGIAIFWWNLNRNGRTDRKTVHAGCPVIVGDKWIANKWVHERGQLLTRPCALDKTQ